MIGNISKSKGFKGDAGEQGIQGIQGEQGIQGVKGDTPVITFRYDRETGNLYYSSDGVLVDKEYVDSNNLVTKDTVNELTTFVINLDMSFAGDKTYDEIVAAYNEGKEIIGFMSDMNITFRFIITACTAEGVQLITQMANLILTISCTSDNVWSIQPLQLVSDIQLNNTLESTINNKISGFEKTENRTIQITEKSTSNEYPTAKAVYNLVNSTEYDLQTQIDTLQDDISDESKRNNSQELRLNSLENDVSNLKQFGQPNKVNIVDENGNFSSNNKYIENEYPDEDANKNRISIGNNENFKDDIIHIGSDIQANEATIVIGHNACADTTDVVIGNEAQGAGGSVVIGEGATNYNGVAIGHHACGEGGVAIGHHSFGNGKSVAIGNLAQVPEGVEAIQIGEGTNDENGTLKVYDHLLMRADGTLPYVDEAIKNIEIPSSEINQLLSLKYSASVEYLEELDALTDEYKFKGAVVGVFSENYLYYYTGNEWIMCGKCYADEPLYFDTYRIIPEHFGQILRVEYPSGDNYIIEYYLHYNNTYADEIYYDYVRLVVEDDLSNYATKTYTDTAIQQAILDSWEVEV